MGEDEHADEDYAIADDKETYVTAADYEAYYYL